MREKITRNLKAAARKHGVALSEETLNAYINILLSQSFDEEQDLWDACCEIIANR
jgi:hypothetical protein